MSQRWWLAFSATALVAALLPPGCHSNTVQVIAEDPDEVPELVFDILDAPSGAVSVDTVEKKDWLFPWTRRRTTTIRVAPGSRVIVVASTQPRHDIEYIRRAASQPATQPATDEVE